MEMLQSYVKDFEKYLQSQLEVKNPVNLYEPINYILTSPGKRIRPVLVNLGYELYKDDVINSMPAALAVEIFHNFTLVHDDIMDEAKLRRGKPAVHEKYNLPTAILSGDVMMMYAYKYLLDYQDPELLHNIINVFTENAIKLCEGQQMDMDFEDSNEVSIEDYIQMITNKTSILLGVCLQIGGTIAGASKDDQHHLYEFGKNIGIAFQIQDDVLDVFGDNTKVGKVTAGDIIKNKKTYLYLKALELASQEERELLTQHYNTSGGDSEIKVKEVTKIFQNLAVKEYASQVKEAYLDLGLSHLEAIKAVSEKKEKLRLLAGYLISRDY